MEISVVNWWRKHHESSTSEGLRLFGFCVVSWKDPSESGIQRNLEEKDRMDHTFSKLQRLTESVESRLNSSGLSSQDSQRCSSAVKSQIYWADYEKHQKLSREGFYLCWCSTTFLVERKTMKKKVWCRTKVIHWSRFRKEVVLNQRGLSTRNLGQYRGEDVGGIRRKRMSDFPCYDSIVQMSTQKQRTFAATQATIETFHIINCFCKSAQSSRSSRGHVWRIWIPSR